MIGTKRSQTDRERALVKMQRQIDVAKTRRDDAEVVQRGGERGMARAVGLFEQCDRLFILLCRLFVFGLEQEDVSERDMIIGDRTAARSEGPFIEGQGLLKQSEAVLPLAHLMQNHA